MTPYGDVHKAGSAIDRRISTLHLIMHRIRVNYGINILNDESSILDSLYLKIDVEDFFVWLRVILDLIAYMTPYFYEQGIDIMQRHSFNKQLDWYKKMPSFDMEYTNFLINDIEQWFVNLKSIRDDSIHHQFWAYVDFKGTKKGYLLRMKGNKTISEEPILKAVGSYYNTFIEFSKFYEEIFLKKLIARGYEKHPHFSGSMIAKYSTSINHLINAGNS
ncbi:MAG: hypothetical protein WCO06_06160 [Candidatus Roizmanbacteria bacterium]